jgi:hypothetical protein
MSTIPKTEIWVCLDKDGYPVFTAGWKEACHEHINDAVLHDKLAGKWVVRQVMELPTKTESVLIEGVAYTLPVEVACELLRLHIDLKTSQAEVEALRKDAARLDWIIDNASSRGGGSGFTLQVFVPVDCECVRTAIDAAIAKDTQALPEPSTEQLAKWTTDFESDLPEHKTRKFESGTYNLNHIADMWQGYLRARTEQATEIAELMPLAKFACDVLRDELAKVEVTEKSKLIDTLQGLLAQPEGEPLTSTYIQTVPDKCDRIVWRNHYYRLPINSAPFTPITADDVPKEMLIEFINNHTDNMTYAKTFAEAVNAYLGSKK